MLESWKLRWRIWKLRRSWDNFNEAHNARIEEAKTRKATRVELHDMNAENERDYVEHQEDIRAAHSKYLVLRSAEVIIPLPKWEDKTMWYENYMGRTTLTELGINTVRSALRAERKARLEMFLMWVPGVVGILGALIGLASILVGRK